MTKKQNDIFETAKRLFYKFGVKKVTIEEICEEANVSKMTFYKYFPNKIELAKAVIDNYYSSALGKYEAMMQSDISAEEKIRLTFELKLDNASNLDIEFVSELYKYPDDTIRELLEMWKQRSIDITKKWFIKMQQNGQIMKELSFPVFMLYTKAIQDFAFNDKTIELFRTTHELAHIITRLFMHGVVENKKGQSFNK